MFTERQIELLKKRLCWDEKCYGYLSPSTLSEGQEVMECSECGRTIDKNDFEVIILLRTKEYKQHDETDNLNYINNL